MMEKSVLGMLVLLMVVMGVVGQAAIIEDDFSGTSVDSSIWTSSGTATVSSGYLKVNSGGYVQSIASTSVQDGDIDLIFESVGTSGITSSSTFNMLLGLFSADGSQYVKIVQQYADATCVYVKGASGSEVSYWTKNASRNLTGPMLRQDSGGQTWRIVLTGTTLKIYVDDTQYVSLTAGQTVGWPYGGGTVVIPTADLYVKFLQNSTTSTFQTSGITLVPEPTTLGLLVLGMLGLIRRKK
jgi:hypothetical protein